ncbi:MAG: SPASM domain-containing protein [Bacteroidetes bacterium]|nr:SPASM domain-containing protein [Bacteroidota bacterium]
MTGYISSYISALNLTRITNFLKNEGSYYFSLVSGKPRVSGLPWSISIEPTTSCNLRCPECPSGLRQFTRPTGNLSLETFIQFLDPLSKHLIYLTLYFQGEPTLNREFIEMVKYARTKRIFVATSTNGHFLDDDNARQLVESGLDRLIISLDGLDQETYEKYRVGGNITKVLSGIQNIIRWKEELHSRKPFVELQFLVLKTNEHQLTGLKAFSREMNVDKLTLKSAQLYHPESSQFLTNLEEKSRYKPDETGKPVIKGKLPNRCHRLWHAAVITWDGKVLPCCFDKDASHAMGDLNEYSFSEIWQQPPYKDFRRNIFSCRKTIEICRNCNEGL